MTQSASSIAAVSMRPVELSEDQCERVVQRKATCPFIASAIKTGELAVYGHASRPLARIDDLVTLGDSGGGDLGSRVLKVFARGNHSNMPNPVGLFCMPAPEGMISLDLAGSPGAHAGHSGILLGNPTSLDGGRFSSADFARLRKHVDQAGNLTCAAVGKFVASNVLRDPDASVLPLVNLLRDVLGVVDELGDSLLATVLRRHTPRDTTELLEKLTALAGEDNLIGSAGEFGLLFAFLANRPDAQTADKNSPLTISFADVELMMAHKRFPDDWERWPKQSVDWVHATTQIAYSAAKELLVHKHRGVREPVSG